MPKSILYCFTSSFPFGNKETFFENELPYLAKAYNKVVIVPMYNPYENEVTRVLPSNVIYLEPSVSQNKVKRIIKGLFAPAPIKFYISDFFKFQVFTSKFRFLKWFNSLLVYKTQYNQVKSLLRKHTDHDQISLYSYWAEAPIFSTELLKKQFKILRLHRVDVYLEENHGYLPIRKQIYGQSDLLIPISTDIKNLLNTYYKIPLNKIFISRLGTTKPVGENFNQENDHNVIRIVTCSRIEKVKRLDYLVKCLSEYSGDKIVEWHHFGDGKLFDELKDFIKKVKNDFFNVVFHGWATQEEIYHFYNTNYVDWFINVSSSEGIPVSIMEAMSFGIPVIATNVGGTGEIVNNDTGVILPKHFEIGFFLENLIETEGHRYNEKRIQSKRQWEENYNADKNYNKLVELFQRKYREYI